IDILLSLWKQKSARVEQWLDGLPMIIVDNGRPLKDLMKQARLDEQDVLSAARERQGLERMDQIKYAVLEVSGGISIIPKQ
ncbi:MAG: YetF domain-containing protein, partial [Nitrospiraceae bacterium]